MNERIPQTNIRDFIYNHFNDNGSGKTPKLLFIGYDGCIASIVGTDRTEDGTSAVSELVNNGGKAYLIIREESI